MTTARSDPPDGAVRRPGGRGAGLDRQTIIAAVTRIVERDGVDALSMRAVGRELGVHAQAIYWHFTSKDELLHAVADSLTAEFTIEPPPGATARAELEHLFHQLLLHFRRHTVAHELGMRRRPAMPNAFTDRCHRLLREMGLDVAEARLAFGSLLWTTSGFVQVGSWLQDLAAPVPPGASPVLPFTWVVEGEVLSGVVDPELIWRRTIRLVLDGIEQAGRTPIE